MIVQWEPVLKDVISEVLEKMCFAMIEFDEIPAGRAFDFESEIRISNQKGWMGISLRVSEQFARTITANLLGIDEDQVGEDDLQDTLKELANMVGGSYQARAKSEGWSLGIPTAWRIGEKGEKCARPDATELRFGCMGEAMGSAVLDYVAESTN